MPCWQLTLQGQTCAFQSTSSQGPWLVLFALAAVGEEPAAAEAEEGAEQLPPAERITQLEAELQYAEQKIAAGKATAANAVAALELEKKVLGSIVQVWVGYCLRRQSARNDCNISYCPSYWNSTCSLQCTVSLAGFLAVFYTTSTSTKLSPTSYCVFGHTMQTISSVRGVAIPALKLFSSSPPATFQVLRAVLLLLGREPAGLATWREASQQLHVGTFQELAAYDAAQERNMELWKRYAGSACCLSTDDSIHRLQPNPPWWSIALCIPVVAVPGTYIQIETNSSQQHGVGHCLQGSCCLQGSSAAQGPREGAATVWTGSTADAVDQAGM